MSLNKWIVRLSFSSAAVLVELALIETALQLIDFPRSETPHQRLFVEFDETRGWRNIANAQGQYSSREYSVYLKYNSHGIRGPERPYPKPAGTFRIVVVGDSFIEGYSVEEVDRVTEVLEQSLTVKMARLVEVIALGTGGYSTDQELLWLESEGLQYQPDLVVLMFYYNDIWSNNQSSYWRGGKPLYIWEKESIRLINVPIPKNVFDASRDIILSSDSSSGIAALKISKLVSRAAQNSRWLPAVGATLGLIQLPPEQSVSARFNVPVLNELTVYQENATPEIDDAWETTRALLKQMKAESENSGARFLIFYVPSKLDVYREDWNLFKSNYGLVDKDWDSRQVARDLIDACHKIGALCIDPTDQFIERQNALMKNNARLYYPVDEHWNANGHHLAASILTDLVLNQLSISR